MIANSPCNRRLGTLIVTCLLLICSSAIPGRVARAQTGCPGTPVYDTTPSPLTGVINSYYPGRETDAAAGETAIDIGPRTGATAVLAAGNLALVIQMQDASIDDSNDDTYGDGTNESGSGIDNPGRGSTALNSAGLYEYVRVTSVTGTAPNQVVNFTGTGSGGGLVNTYRARANDSSGSTQFGQSSYQVIRVPQYENATVAAGLTAKAWSGPVVSTGPGGNGPTGGVLVFDVSGTLTLASQTISVDGLGFRGGGGRVLTGGAGADNDFRTLSSNNANGSKGEGIAGTPRFVWNAAGAALVDNGAANEGYPQGSYGRGAPGNAGGGSTDGNPNGAAPNGNDQNSGGGGGGNCGQGGKGGNAWSSQDRDGGWGGAGSGPTLTRIFMGGGGGAGTTNNGSQSGGPDPGDGRYSSGGAGGGIILIRSYTMSGGGTFSANGANSPFHTGRDGAGGGGAGGTIGLTFRFADRAMMSARANGAIGMNAWPLQAPDGNPGERHGPGGGGGGGFIMTSGSIGSTSVTGGANGITTTANSAYGSSAGSAGCTDETYVFTSVPGVSSGGECNYVASVDLVQSDAKRFDSGTLLTWTTSSESENLGFNIYRDDNGTRQRINPGLIAGAALKTTARMLAGHNYSWWDPDATASSRYWIEDVGFTGTGTVYGPFMPYAVRGQAPVVGNSERLASKRGETGADAGRVIWEDPSAEPVKANGKGGSSTGTPPSSPTAAQWAVASRPGLKLAVSALGWYQVGSSDLASAGIDPSQFDPRTIKLFADGVQVPIQVSGETDGRFDAGDTVEFLGNGVDTPYTNTRVYYLTAGDGPGLRMKVVPHVDGPVVRPSLPSTVELKKRTVHFSALANGEKENIFGDILAFEPLDQIVALPHVDVSASTAKVEVALQGVTLVPHQVTVAVNGSPVGKMVFAGKESRTGTFTVPASLLASGNNTITLTPDSATYDVSLVDFVRVTYSRLPLSDGTPIASSVPAVRQVVALGGFASQSIRVIDGSNIAAPQEILGSVAQGANGYEIAVRMPATSNRVFAFTPDQVRRPDRIEVNTPSAWNRTTQPYNVVFLTTTEFAPALAPLVALRQQQGYRVAVVDIEDVYDEFGFGYRSPAAVRALIDRARNWSTPLRHVLIAGDASLDPRNYFGLGGNFVPTKSVETFSMETFSDDWMADVNGDEVPDVSMGRLPVIGVEELETVVGKIVRYEAQVSAPRQVVAIADTGDTYDFGGASDRMSDLVPGPSAVTSIHRLEIGDQAARTAVLDSFAAGSDLVVHAGHGSVAYWRGGLLTSDDVMEVQSSGRLSVSVLANCLNGYFTAPGLRSIGEALVLTPNGGSVVAWASSGTSDSGWQELLVSEFLRQAYRPGVTTGDAARAAKASVNGEVRKTWVFLGDPLVRLK